MKRKKQESISWSRIRRERIYGRKYLRINNFQIFIKEYQMYIKDPLITLKISKSFKEV